MAVLRFIMSGAERKPFSDSSGPAQVVLRKCSFKTPCIRESGQRASQHGPIWRFRPPLRVSSAARLLTFRNVINSYPVSGEGRLKLQTQRLRWCLLVVFACSTWADVTYMVTDLAPGVSGSAVATGINNAGQVTGSAASHAFLYSDGQIADLGTRAGYLFSSATAINNEGQVVGYLSNPDPRPFTFYRSFLYSKGQIADLGTFGGFDARANGINDAGQVVGYVSTSSGQHAFLYSNGQMTDLGPLVANGINNTGQIVGSQGVSGIDSHAVLYSNGEVQELGLPGASYSVGQAINNAGQVVGSSSFPVAVSSAVSSSTHGFVYSNGNITDLGNLGGPISSPYDINDAGDIVGISWIPSLFLSQTAGHAFLYRNGQMVDLNGLIDPALGITLTEARGINDEGQIVANGVPSIGSPLTRPFLLTPISAVPEPSTWALLGTPALLLLVWFRQHPLRKL